MDFVAISGGWYHSMGLKQVATVIDEPRVSPSRTLNIEIHALTPNPFNPSTMLSFSSRLSGTAAFYVYDLAGRLISHHEMGHIVAGQYHVRWDGCNGEGHEVASGLYVLQIRNTLGESSTVKGILLR
jgi:flagellar hook assembly protein FlgD